MYFSGGKENTFFFRNAYTGAGRLQFQCQCVGVLSESRLSLIYARDFFWEEADQGNGVSGKVGTRAQKNRRQTCDLGTTYTHTHTGFDKDPLPSLPSPSAIGKSGSLDLGYVTLCLIRPRGFENLA